MPRTPTRRRFLALASAALPFLPRAALAQNTKPAESKTIVGSWVVNSHGVFSDVKLTGESKTVSTFSKGSGMATIGGSADLVLQYRAGPNSGWEEANLKVEHIGPAIGADSIKLFADGRQIDAFVTGVAPHSLKKLFGEDLQGLIAVRALKVTMTIEGTDQSILEATLEGTAAMLDQAPVTPKLNFAALVKPKSNSGPPQGPPGRSQVDNCFLTTACCEEVGLADGCFELTALRRFRDEVMSKTTDGRGEVAAYYAEAPLILAAMAARGERGRLIRLYATHILPSAVMAHFGWQAGARRLYTDMMRRLRRRYSVPA